MIDGDELSDARSRLPSDADRDIWDRALQAAQGEKKNEQIQYS